MKPHVYKYTNKTTGKWYIGSHNGSNLNYSGSGLLFSKAKEKYGLDSFDKEILYEGDLFREKEEEILKSLDAANDPMSYNMKNEALGGSFFGENNGMFGKTPSDETKYLNGAAFRGKKRPDHSIKMSGENNPRYGKTDHMYGLEEYVQARTGKTNKEYFGEEKAKQISETLSKANKGKKHNLKTVKCPHCNKEGSGPNMTRYHFDNCKNKDI